MEMFNDILETMYQNSEPRDLVDYVEKDIHLRRFGFARYAVAKAPMNERRFGSAASESNNASLLARIGEGSIEEPATAIKRCILRDTELNNKRAMERSQ